MSGFGVFLGPLLCLLWAGGDASVASLDGTAPPSPEADSVGRPVDRRVSAPALDTYFDVFLSQNGLLDGDDPVGFTEGSFFWLDALLEGEGKHRQGYYFDALLQYQLITKRSSIPRTVSHAVQIRLGQVKADMYSAVAGLQSFKQALSFDAESHVAYFHMGLMLVRQSRVTEAIEAFRTAVFYRHDDIKSLHMLGSVAFLRGRTDEARYFFQSALARDRQWQTLIAAGLPHELPVPDASAAAEAVAAHILSVFDAKVGSATQVTNAALHTFVTQDARAGMQLSRQVARRCAEAAIHQGSHELAKQLLDVILHQQAMESSDQAVLLRRALLLPRVASTGSDQSSLLGGLLDRLQHAHSLHSSNVPFVALVVPFWTWAPILVRHANLGALAAGVEHASDPGMDEGTHSAKALEVTSKTFRAFSRELSYISRHLSSRMANGGDGSGHAGGNGRRYKERSRHSASKPLVIRVGMVVDSVTARRSVVRLAGFAIKLVTRGRETLASVGSRRAGRRAGAPSRLSLTTLYTLGEVATPVHRSDPGDAHVSSPQQDKQDTHELRSVDGFGGVVVHAGEQSGGAIALPFPANITACQRLVERQNFDVLLFMGPDVGEMAYWLAHARLAPVQAAYWMGQLTSGIAHTLDYVLTSAAFVSSLELAQAHSMGITTEQRVLLSGIGTYLLRPARVQPPFPYKFGKHLYLFEKKNYYLIPFDTHLVAPDMDEIVRMILDTDSRADILFLDISARVVAREVLINRILQGRGGRGGGRLRFVPRLSLNELDGLMAAVRVVLDIVPQYSPASYAMATEALSLGTPIVTLIQSATPDTIVGHAAGEAPRPHAPDSLRSNVVAALYAHMGMDWRYPPNFGGADTSDGRGNMSSPVLERDEACCSATTKEAYVNLAVRLANRTNETWSSRVSDAIATRYGVLFEDMSVVHDLDVFLRRVGAPSARRRRERKASRRRPRE